MKIVYLVACALAGTIAGFAFVAASPLLAALAAACAGAACVSALRLLNVV